MAPNITESSTKHTESIANKIEIHESVDLENKNDEEVIKKKSKGWWFEFETEPVWPNIIGIAIFHLILVYALCNYSYVKNLRLTLWGFFIGTAAGFGITGGAHRFWTHRTYKANVPLRIILAVCYLMAGMNSIFNWVRDHRIHHKYTETSADPHDTNRGFFFSHMGWLMLKKHPEVIRRGKQIDMSDIIEDPVAHFVDTHFTRLKLLFCFILPTVIPVYWWGQDWTSTILAVVFIRYAINLHATWAVNSFAHFFGNHAYDKTLRPAENRWVAFAAMGEGWHNYHHVFPWDYKAAELGNYRLNVTTMWIDIFAKLGWATELKTASQDLIQKITENRGDGSHPLWGKKIE